MSEAVGLGVTVWRKGGEASVVMVVLVLVVGSNSCTGKFIVAWPLLMFL